MKRVALYYNLHKECWSVQSRDKADYGRIIAHVDEALLYDAEYVVRPAGREKVVREGRKNVHAFVVGTWIPYDIVDNIALPAVRINYNPHRNTSFMCLDTPINKSDYAMFTWGRQCFAVGTRIRNER